MVSMTPDEQRNGLRAVVFALLANAAAEPVLVGLMWTLSAVFLLASSVSRLRSATR